MAEETIVVFDFDKTIIDLDSDNWVVDELGATELFDQLVATMPWNSLMDRMAKELHTRGNTIEDIEGVLKRAPLHPRIIAAIKEASASGCDLRIVSDANVFFIETILNHHGLREHFSEINTNPSLVDGDGRLRIFPYHDFRKASHGCPLCPPNMCKGQIIERIQASAAEDGKEKRIIYLGDGNSDYCPSLKLGDGDFVMPRKNCPLSYMICKNPKQIKADIHEWTYGEEFELVLMSLISTNADALLASPAGWKLQVAPDSDAAGAALEEALLKACTVSSNGNNICQNPIISTSQTCSYSFKGLNFDTFQVM